MAGRGETGYLFVHHRVDKGKRRNHSPEPRSLLDLQQLDVKGQLAVGGDAGHAARAVAQVGGDGQATLAADSHTDDTDVPALDDLALADLEGERLALLVGCREVPVSGTVTIIL